MGFQSSGLGDLVFSAQGPDRFLTAGGLASGTLRAEGSEFSSFSMFAYV